MDIEKTLERIKELNEEIEIIADIAFPDGEVTDDELACFEELFELLVAQAERLRPSIMLAFLNLAAAKYELDFLVGSIKSSHYEAVLSLLDEIVN